MQKSFVKLKRPSPAAMRYKRAMLIRRDGMWCGICHLSIKEKKDVSVDHIKPLAKGGSNELDNMQLAHKRCNEQKGMRLMKTQNRLFIEAFSKLDLSPFMEPRYVPVRVWGLFPAAINLKSLEVELNDEHWWITTRLVFNVVSIVCSTFQEFILNEDPFFFVHLSPKEMAKLSEIDKIRIRQIV